MWECRTYGSVRGVPGDRHPYRDSSVPLRLCVNAPNHLQRHPDGTVRHFHGANRDKSGQQRIPERIDVPRFTLRWWQLTSRGVWL
jgi:hypothetical protein